MDVGELTRQIAVVIAAAERARQATTEAAGLLGQARDTWVQAIEGTHNPEVAAVTREAQETAATCERVANMLMLAGNHLRAYLASIGGNAPQALSRPGASTGTSVTRTSTDAVQAARRRLGHGRAGTKAAGEWIRADGSTIRIESTPTDRRFGPTYDYLVGRFGRRAARLARHIEVKIAHAMIEDGLTDETVVIDREVCGTRDYDREEPLTCDKYLPRILPPGARLRVIQADGTIREYEGRDPAR